MKLFKTVLLLLCAVNATAQSNLHRPVYTIDIGADQSICANEIGHVEGTKNPYYWVEYSPKRRYDNPGLRIQASVMRPYKNIRFGVQAGAVLHWSQRYYGVETPFGVSVPVQIKIQPKLASIGQSILYLDLVGGVTFTKLAYNPYYAYNEGGGPLLSGGFWLQMKNRFYFKIGYEHETDKGSYNVPYDPLLSPQPEIIRFNQVREQLYFGVGYSF